MFVLRPCLVASVLICLLPFAVNGQAVAVRQHQHNMVVMRMIGHQVLLSTGDHSSRVMPIEQEADGYRIRFGDDLEVDTDRLVSIIDSVMRLNHMPRNYLVQMEQCSTDVVVYSYEVNDAVAPEEVACKGRPQPKDCYSLFITFAQLPVSTDPASTEGSAPSTSTESALGNGPWPLALGIALVCAIAVAFLLRRKKHLKTDTRTDAPTEPDPNMIPIGSYLFDRRNMVLWHNATKDELTGKEADLLSLLHASVNSTVERDVILKDVWGDEGAYVGRTLDVFISKLRKKLEADPSVRIVNVRGVGYRLILGRGEA